MICLRNTKMYYLTDYLNQLISHMKNREKEGQNCHITAISTEVILLV